MLAVGTAIYYLYKHLWGAGIVFALFAVFAIFCFISWIPRIPFAVVMLQQTMDIARLPRVHVFIISLMGGIASLAFGAWFSVTLVAIYTAYMPSNSGSAVNPSCADSGCSSGKVIGLVVFVTFAGYWISEWLKNTIHTSVAGVYGSWYFCAGKPGGIPKGASMGAFKRATTYSFGSISLGSLIVAPKIPAISDTRTLNNVLCPRVYLDQLVPEFGMFSNSNLRVPPHCNEDGVHPTRYWRHEDLTDL